MNHDNHRRSRISRGIIGIGEIGDYHLDKEVNLMGIVVEFSFPRKSKGTDFVSILKIVDRSPQSPELSVNIFTQKVEHLPVLKSHGDVILLHNVTIKKHLGELNAVFNKKFSSFGLFGGSDTSDISCYQAFGSFSPLWAETNYIIDLRDWWTNARIDLGKSEYLLSMKDIIENTFFDLVCQVLHVSYDVPKGLWMLFVWDGSDVPLLSLDQRLKDEEKDSLPLQVESVPLGRDVLCKFCHVGTVLRVMANECHENLGLQFQGIGKWVRIRNMSVKVLAGMWYGALNPLSRVRLLADNDSVVVDCKRSFQERKSKRDRLPLWSPDHSLTEIECDETESIQFMTLMDVVTREKDDDLFYCAVRVVAMYPIPTKELYRCDLSSERVMRLTLEDPTARIRAFLLGEDLVKFMNGYSGDVVMGKMKRILGMAEHEKRIDDDGGGLTRFPPYMKCCIDTARDDDGGGGETFYICRTRLI